MSNIDSFTVQPPTNLLETLAHSGYTLETAVSDIIDNSITAKAKNIHVRLDINGLKTKLFIVDDGDGMTLAELKAAAVTASKSIRDHREEDDLGRYSLGLKSASISFCNKLYIISKSKENKVHTVLLNFAEMIDKNDWSAHVLHDFTSPFELQSSGTIIMWENLKITNETDMSDQDFYNTKLEKLEEHLSHVFYDYIAHQDLKVFVQGSKVAGWDPFFSFHTSTSLKKIDPILYKGDKIHISTYILPVLDTLNNVEITTLKGRGLEEQQGFYIYRNKRLISEGTWLDLPNLNISNKYNFARIRVDITSKMDSDFKVNFMKNSITLPDSLKKDFLKIAREARTKSHKNYNYMKKEEISKVIKEKREIPVWQKKETPKGIVLLINGKHPIISDLLSPLSPKNQQKLLNLISKNIPVGQLQRSIVVTKYYNSKELESLMLETYSTLSQQGKSLEQIKKTMATYDPFYKHLYELVDFFTKLEEKISNEKTVN